MIFLWTIVLQEQTSVFSVAAIVGALAGILGGLISSILEGLAAQRMEALGKVTTIPKAWNIAFLKQEGMRLGASDKSTANTAHYAFTVRFFNRKRVDTGIRDVAVEFLKGTEVRVTHIPYDPAKPVYPEGSVPDPQNPPAGYEEVDLINLPSRAYVQQKCRGKLGPEDTAKVADCDRVRFVGYFASDRRFSVDLAKLD